MRGGWAYLRHPELRELLDVVFRQVLKWKHQQVTTHSKGSGPGELSEVRDDRERWGLRLTEADTPRTRSKWAASRCRIKACEPGVGGRAFPKGFPESGFYVKFLDFYIVTNNFNLNATRAKL